MTWFIADCIVAVIVVAPAAKIMDVDHVPILHAFALLALLRWTERAWQHFKRFHADLL